MDAEEAVKKQRDLGLEGREIFLPGDSPTPISITGVVGFGMLTNDLHFSQPLDLCQKRPGPLHFALAIGLGYGRPQKDTNGRRTAYKSRIGQGVPSPSGLVKLITISVADAEGVVKAGLSMRGAKEDRSDCFAHCILHGQTPRCVPNKRPLVRAKLLGPPIRYSDRCG